MGLSVYRCVFVHLCVCVWRISGWLGWDLVEMNWWVCGVDVWMFGIFVQSARTVSVYVCVSPLCVSLCVVTRSNGESEPPIEPPLNLREPPDWTAHPVLNNFLHISYPSKSMSLPISDRRRLLMCWHIVFYAFIIILQTFTSATFELCLKFTWSTFF